MVERNLYCKHYPACLSIHVRCGKYKFSCFGCTRYAPIHFTPEEAVEEGIKAGEFLNVLFFQTDPYEGKHKMKQKVSDDEMVLVPARVLKAIMFSFTTGMSYFAGTSNLIEKLDGILKQEKTHGQFVSDVSRDTNEGGPRTENF